MIKYKIYKKIIKKNKKDKYKRYEKKINIRIKIMFL